ncbi:MAG TPA: mechanosensitive ion channel domain-containing protein, partial [Gemmatimonadaceae bacterium]
YTGDVIKSRLQVTHLRTIKNEEVVIPNSRLLSSDVLNYSTLARVHGLVLHTDVSIGYDTSWRQVEALLIQAAERTRELGPDPRPYVQLKKLGDFAVQYELNVHCADVHAMQALYSALHRNILDVFNEAGVQIMTPVYEGDPPQPKIVPPEAWYPPPVVRSAVAAGRDGPRPPPDEQAHQSPLAAAPPNRT